MGRKKKKLAAVIASDGFYQRITLLPDGERRIETLPIKPNMPIPLGPVTVDLSTLGKRDKLNLARKIYVESLLKNENKEEGTE